MTELAVRILQLLLSPRIGGAETLAASLEQSWSGRNLETRIVYLDPTGVRKGRTSRLVNLTRAIQSYRPDAILAHTFLPSMYARAASMGRVPVHVVLHSGGNDYGSLLSVILEKALQPVTASLIAVGDRPLEVYRSHFPKSAPITRINNGVSESFQPKLTVSPSLTRVISVARVDAVKRPDVWEAVTTSMFATHPSIRFEWWGPLSGRADLDKFVTEPRSPNAHYMGPTSDVPSVMREADALLHTSDYEASGIALLEAAVTGLPVVYASSVRAPSQGTIWANHFGAGSVEDCVRSLASLSEDWENLSRMSMQFAVTHGSDLGIASRADDYLEWITQARS